jgi:hypothetical protein
VTAPTTCIRRAWLTLGPRTLPLEDAAAGQYVTTLDLGYPTVRDVVSNRPDALGIDDRTSLWGERLISANVTATGQPVDALAASFAPFMVPWVRPVLHYVLDYPEAEERTLTVRAANYSWPITGGRKREIQLQWVAADPIARTPTVNEATAWAGTGPVLGRVYDLVPPRAYPVGAGLASAGQIVGHGDVPVQPYLRIFGPISDPRVTFDTAGPPVKHSEIGMLYRIDAGHFVGIDTRLHTARLDDDAGKSVLSELDWPRLIWPVLPNAPDTTTMQLTGTGTTASSQVAASWQDGYLI